MAISKQLQAEIKDFLVNYLDKKIKNYDLSKNSGNPFIDILFGDLSNLKSFIHSTATSLGSCYEDIAIKIAKSNPNFVKAEKIKLKGSLSDAEKSLIKDIVKDLEESAKRSKKAKTVNNGSIYSDEIARIYSASIESLKETEIVIDLYLQTKEGKEFFIEMKGPDPNKKEVRADMAYLSRKNLQIIVDNGAIPFIPFKSNSQANKKGSMVWSKMYQFCKEKPQEFFEHYHRRSNVETTFSMIKQKFGKEVVSRNFTSQTNEVLLKILCHNICCLISAYFEKNIKSYYSTNPPQSEVVLRLG